MQDFLALCLRFIDHTLRANRRADGLYHAYNVLRLGDGTAAVDRLYEMLEGQVAILLRMLSPEEALDLLQALRQSRMYRADQHSYLLYPDRDLPIPEQEPDRSRQGHGVTPGGSPRRGR